MPFRLTRHFEAFLKTVSSVDNWGSLSFVLNRGTVVQIWVGWFRLRYSSTLFLFSNSYARELSTG